MIHNDTCLISLIAWTTQGGSGCHKIENIHQVKQSCLFVSCGKMAKKIRPYRFYRFIIGVE